MRGERSAVEATGGPWRDDLDLATACADGNAEAWREFERSYFGYIRAFCRRFDLPDGTATDVAQDVIADLWQRRKITRYAGRSSLRTWLGAVVTNAALNARARERRRGRTQDPGSRAAGAEVIENDAQAERYLTRAIREALVALPVPDRLLVLFHYEQGLTLAEMALLRRSSKATLSRKLTGIRGRLRVEIERVLEAEHGTSWRDLRADLDLSRLDFDLSGLFAGAGSERSADPRV
ncbi:MAG TPA: sigma-70 family RNA polymerase sigma factor [Gemmatimonadota bacterium]|nr:sigma-70 family RNA polymerase sigma factor [Gemmatimonadota bacterium]